MRAWDMCQTQACINLQQERLLIRAKVEDASILLVNLDTHLVGGLHCRCDIAHSPRDRTGKIRLEK